MINDSGVVGGKTHNSLVCEFFSNSNDQNVIYFTHANIRSMRTNFHDFVADISISEERLCFIVLSEIWIDDEELPLY